MHHQHTRKSEKKKIIIQVKQLVKNTKFCEAAETHYRCDHHQLTHVTPKIKEKTKRFQNYDQGEIQIIIKIKPFPKIRNWTFQILQYPSNPEINHLCFHQNQKKVTKESERTKPNGKKTTSLISEENIAKARNINPQSWITLFHKDLIFFLSQMELKGEEWWKKEQENRFLEYLIRGCGRGREDNLSWLWRQVKVKETLPRTLRKWNNFVLGTAF